MISDGTRGGGGGADNLKSHSVDTLRECDVAVNFGHRIGQFHLRIASAKESTRKHHLATLVYLFRNIF